MRTFLTATILLCCSVCSAYNGEWMPYVATPIPPQVQVPLIPSVTYSTEIYVAPRPYVLTYDWVPYQSSKTVVVERYGIFCKHKTIIQQPVIEWVYQPVWR